MDINLQTITIYGDFVTSLTAYYSCADISIMMYTLVADHDVSILVVNNFLNIDNILYDIGNSVILIYNNTHEKNVSSQRQK